MDIQAHELLNRREWTKAAEIYNQLLRNKEIHLQECITYLLGRSECFYNLGQYEAVVADCRTIINLLVDEIDVEGETIARKRLVYALFQLRRFTDAELATREWAAQKGRLSSVMEARTLLEKLHANYQSTIEHPSNDFNKFEVIQYKYTVSCTYCGITFNDKMQLRGHCQTAEHQRMIMSDEGRDWLWRAPPRGFSSDNYTICETFLDTGTCRYGNQCIEAHGEEELNEWKERFEYRKMKLKKAYDKELYGKSYTEQLLERWIESSNPNEIMQSKLDYVKDGCCSDLTTTVSSKNSEKIWNFIFVTSKPLHAVALLEDTHRNHFAISKITLLENKEWMRYPIENIQEWLTPMKPDGDFFKYKVQISFKTEIFGTFRQAVVFDFGCYPVLVKHLCVDVIPIDEVEKINNIRKEIVLSSTERWTIENVQILPFTSELISIAPAFGCPDLEWSQTLLKMYPTPQANNFTLSQVTLNDKKFNKHNYNIRMHELLYIEEMARYEQIGKYNLTTSLRIAHSYLLSPNGMANSTAKYSNSGELFALLNLSRDISEDTSAGRLIMNNCITVLLAPDYSEDDDCEFNKIDKAYEALIEDKGKNVIYLRLSAQTVSDLNLKPDQEFKAQIQFQLNRQSYCEWHHAIDKIGDTRLIFPDTFLEPNIPWSPQRQWSNIPDSRLNLKQKEAIVAITTPLYVPLPPILIIGPFGTGKTFTLAQAIKQLIAQPEHRILICTHSNSAADLYIKEYLHPFVENDNDDIKPLRIYYHRRWVSTVHQVVQKYCLIESINGVKCFRIPMVEDIMKHRIIVVTLSISMYLATMNLPRGYFTHIFLDEAAQAMECEAIMPLALANESTRIVLAGDHMQLSPEIFSHFARERNLHVSLLERLYDHYPSTFSCKILLSENYRAHEAIINYASESFYDQKLIASGRQPRHELYYPLTFFTTRGEDVQDKNSTGFYNNSEVYEIVERVCELKKRWPLSWGKIDGQSIGIVTPYSDQVFRIRSELRKRRMYGISVERVLNVQGKQFRAIFLSTVRTRRTCTGNKKASDDMDFGFLSNSKLLNTAITRAQSLVAVVGDPVALCSIGRCSKLWERFLQICHDNGSLYGITWSVLKSQLDGVELKKTYSLNPLAPEFIPRKYHTETYIRPKEIPPQIPIAPILPHPVIIHPYTQIEPPPPPPPTHPPEYYNQTAPINHQMPMTNQIFTVRRPWTYLPPPDNKHKLPPNMQANIPMKSATYVPIQPNQMPPPPPPEQAARLINPNAIQNDKGLIQFFNNVHFPEQNQFYCTNANNTGNNNAGLNELINLLPVNMSLAEMLMQTYNFQESWYVHLFRTKGLEVAKKFEFLITTCRKDQPMMHPSQQINLNATMPMLHAEMPELKYYDKTLNQININKPIYYKDLYDIGNITNFTDVRSSGDNKPLYKRQAENNHIIPTTITTGNAASSSSATTPTTTNVINNNNDYIANNCAIREQHLQQQINADFANLSIHNRDIVEDFLKTYNRMSYANVLMRNTPQRNNNNNNNNAELCSLNINSNSNETSSGPRLYKYFS